jgi:inorganic pyrophosphatase
MKLPTTFIKKTDNINVIIETPKGGANKYSYDEKTGLFKLSKILGEGLVFPHHFGFIPQTQGEDGDPLDVLVLMDEPTYPGNLIECRVLGVIEAEQTEKNGEKNRNDRILCTALQSRRFSTISSLKQLDKFLIEEITKFFVTYNAMDNKKFDPIAFKGPVKAIKLIQKQQI